VLRHSCAGDIKLAQVRVLATKLAQLSQQYQSAVIMCGDFNSTPDSAIYRFCSAGKLALSRVDRRTMSGQLGDAVSPGSLVSGWLM
jgi:endonuclease/exonuclease/phosphatase family metal-dependent hydrolase